METVFRFRAVVHCDVSESLIAHATQMTMNITFLCEIVNGKNMSPLVENVMLRQDVEDTSWCWSILLSMSCCLLIGWSTARIDIFTLDVPWRKYQRAIALWRYRSIPVWYLLIHRLDGDWGCSCNRVLWWVHEARLRDHVGTHIMKFVLIIVRLPWGMTYNVFDQALYYIHGS